MRQVQPSGDVYLVRVCVCVCGGDSKKASSEQRHTETCSEHVTHARLWKAFLQRQAVDAEGTHWKGA